MSPYNLWCYPLRGFTTAASASMAVTGFFNVPSEIRVANLISLQILYVRCRYVLNSRYWLQVYPENEDTNCRFPRNGWLGPLLLRLYWGKIKSTAQGLGPSRAFWGYIRAKLNQNHDIVGVICRCILPLIAGKLYMLFVSAINCRHLPSFVVHPSR